MALFGSPGPVMENLEGLRSSLIWAVTIEHRCVEPRNLIGTAAAAATVQLAFNLSGLCH
jgi:hypothetical protein